MKKVLSLLTALLLILCLGGCLRPADAQTPSDSTAPVQTDTTADTTAPEPEPEPEPEDKSVTIRMVGDILLHEAVTESGLKSDGSYNFDHLFANVKSEIEEADIALVNQEVILGGSEMGLSGYPAFNGPFEVGDAIADAGFDIVLHATNHALDRGSRAVINCCNFWRTSHPEVSFIGISDSAEKNNIVIKEAKDIKIAFINYTYGTNGIPLPDGYTNAVTYLDAETIRSDTAYAKENADFVVVCPHWGTEYTHEADSNQKYWTQLFLECGVDLVIGTHPHVTEPIEVLEQNGHTMTVYYSIGNFVNSTAQAGAGIADRMVGAMADVTLERDSAGNVRIRDFGVIPLVTHLSKGYGGITTYKLSDYTEELARQNLIVASDSAFSLEYCKTLTEKVFGDLAK